MIENLNHMLPAEAKDKICHVVLGATGKREACVANECMSWRFASGVTKWSDKKPSGDGWVLADDQYDDDDCQPMWIKPQSGLGFCSKHHVFG